MTDSGWIIEEAGKSYVGFSKPVNPDSLKELYEIGMHLDKKEIPFIKFHIYNSETHDFKNIKKVECSITNEELEELIKIAKEKSKEDKQEKDLNKILNDLNKLFDNDEADFKYSAIDKIRIVQEAFGLTYYDPIIRDIHTTKDTKNFLIRNLNKDEEYLNDDVRQLCKAFIHTNALADDFLETSEYRQELHASGKYANYIYYIFTYSFLYTTPTIDSNVQAISDWHLPYYVKNQIEEREEKEKQKVKKQIALEKAKQEEKEKRKGHCKSCGKKDDSLIDDGICLDCWKKIHHVGHGLCRKCFNRKELYRVNDNKFNNIMCLECAKDNDYLELYEDE